MLLVMAFVPWPFEFEYPGIQVLAGEITLSPEGLNRYVTALQALFIVDGIFLIGWIIAWLGIAALVGTRARLLGSLTLVLGLAGAFFDFTENGIVWALVQGLRLNLSPQPGWLIAWQAIQHLSFWLPYAAAAVAALGLWSRKPLDRVVAVAGTLLVVLAAPGLYVPSLSLLASLWFLIWFACSSLLLWRRAAEWPAAGELKSTASNSVGGA